MSWCPNRALLQETRHERGIYRRRKRVRPRRSRLAMPRGYADLRNHGATDGCSWWRPAGYALLGRARCVTAERNDPDVRADECLPFRALAEADLQPAKQCPPIHRSACSSPPFRRPWCRTIPISPSCDGRSKSAMNTASCVCSRWRSRPVLANALCDQCSLTPSPWAGSPEATRRPMGEVTVLGRVTSSWRAQRADRGPCPSPGGSPSPRVSCVRPRRDGWRSRCSAFRCHAAPER